MNTRQKSFILAFWFTLIFVLLTWPVEPSIYHEFSIKDKVAHFALFGVFAWLMYSLLSEYLFDPVILLIISFGSAVLYSFLGESLQAFIPGRTQSLADLTAGALGAAVALLVANRLYGKKPLLLLHICCIGCGAYLARELADRYKLVLYFYNPNIFPETEYAKRLEEIKKVAAKNNLKVIVGEYDHKNWLDAVAGLENEPEKGKRCQKCFRARLEQAAIFAKRRKIKHFSTTLTISPHKVSTDIIKIGKDIAEKHNLIFLEDDFKKNNGFKKSAELVKELDLYRQNYCGCEFSQKNKI